MRQRRPFSLGALMALAVLVTGLAAALNPTKAGEIWDAFVEMLVAIAWAVVGVFL
jgi:hypothetical protein